MVRRTPPSTAPSTVSSTIAGRNLRLSLASVLMQPPRPPTQSHLGYPILSSSPPTSAETISSSASPPSWNQRTVGHPTTRRSREATHMIGGEPGRPGRFLTGQLAVGAIFALVIPARRRLRADRGNLARDRAGRGVARSQCSDGRDPGDQH